MTSVFMEKVNLDTETYVEERWWEESEGEDGRLQTEGARDRPFPHGLRRSQSSRTLIVDLQPLELEDSKILLCQLPSQQYFARVGLAN